MIYYIKIVRHSEYSVGDHKIAIGRKGSFPNVRFVVSGPQNPESCLWQSSIAISLTKKERNQQPIIHHYSVLDKKGLNTPFLAFAGNQLTSRSLIAVLRTVSRSAKQSISRCCCANGSQNRFVSEKTGEKGALQRRQAQSHCKVLASTQQRRFFFHSHIMCYPTGSVQ